MSVIDHLVACARSADVAGRTTYHSTGEALAAALILDRSDWLRTMGYTMVEAIDRLDADWLALLPEATRRFQDVRAAANEALADGEATATLEQLVGTATVGEPVEFDAKLLTAGSASGYRSATLRFALTARRLESAPTLIAELSIGAEDSAAVLAHFMDVHRQAWRGGEPIDVRAGDQKPSWLV